MNKSPTVYLVDDDELILETLSNVFFAEGYLVKSFSSSQAFLNHTISEPNACIILDLKMPQHDGIEIHRHLNEHGSCIPIIYYTGRADILSAVEVMEEGAVTLLQKPISTDLLLSKTKQAINENVKRLEELEEKISAKNKLLKLTNRELDVAKLVSEGLSAAAIGEKLFISSRTVEAHKASIFQKINTKSVAALTRLVIFAESLD